MALINWAILVWIFRPLMFNKKLRTKWKLFVQLFLQILLNSSRRRIPRSRVKTKNIFAYRRKIPKISRCLNFCCFEFRVERRIFASNASRRFRSSRSNFGKHCLRKLIYRENEQNDQRRLENGRRKRDHEERTREKETIATSSVQLDTLGDVLARDWKARVRRCARKPVAKGRIPRDGWCELNHGGVLTSTWAAFEILSRRTIQYSRSTGYARTGIRFTPKNSSEPFNLTLFRSNNDDYFVK